MSSFSSWLSFWRSTARGRQKPERLSGTASGGSSRNATLPSSGFGGATAKRPSFYLLATSALLLTAGAVGILGGEAPPEGRRTELLSRGWLPWEGGLPCPVPEGSGSFYELENDDDSLEAYGFGRSFLVARPPAPGGEYRCRPITEPHFIQEIL